ncbi:MAG TPA: hypothetical protein VH643_20320 [Gemmataceae bacterium]
MCNWVRRIGVSALAFIGRTSNERRGRRAFGIGALCIVLLGGLFARPACAQTTRSHPQVRLLLAGLRLRATAHSARIVAASQELTQLQQQPQTFATQLRIDRRTAALAENQAALQTVQSAIVVVDQLNSALGAAQRLTLRIEVESNLLVRLQSVAIQTPRLLAQISSLQNLIQADRAALATLQQQIATSQQQVSMLFG